MDSQGDKEVLKEESPPSVLSVGRRISFAVESARGLGKSLAIIVGTEETTGVQIDGILKRSDGVERTIDGLQNPKLNYASWSKQLHSFTERALCSADVVRVEEEKSIRGNFQVHLDLWTIDGMERIVHSDEEIWGQDVPKKDDLLFDAHGDDAEKEQRNAKFEEWISETYSLEALKSGDGVLSVGGGKGELCLRLQARGIKCTVVDPRASVAENESFERMIQKFDHKSFPNRPFSLIVGMHADQGTEHAVLYALTNKIPFAVVPCCVFPSEFPDRRFRDGGVTVYRTFFKYLCELTTNANMNFKTKRLEFKGRNTVLYTIAE